MVKDLLDIFKVTRVTWVYWVCWATCVSCFMVVADITLTARHREPVPAQVRQEGCLLTLLPILLNNKNSMSSAINPKAKTAMPENSWRNPRAAFSP